MAAALPTMNGTAKDGPFALARATVEDMVEMVDLEYACFPPFVCSSIESHNNGRHHSSRENARFEDSFHYQLTRIT